MHRFLNIRLDNIKVLDEARHPHMVRSCDDVELRPFAQSYGQMAVKNCFIRGSVVRYVQLPAEHVDTQLLEDATRRGMRHQSSSPSCSDRVLQRLPRPNDSISKPCDVVWEVMRVCWGWLQVRSCLSCTIFCTLLYSILLRLPSPRPKASPARLSLVWHGHSSIDPSSLQLNGVFIRIIRHSPICCNILEATTEENCPRPHLV